MMLYIMPSKLILLFWRIIWSPISAIAPSRLLTCRLRLLVSFGAFLKANPCCKIWLTPYSLSLRCTRTIKTGRGTSTFSLYWEWCFPFITPVVNTVLPVPGTTNSSLTLNACIRFLGLPICFKRPFILLITTGKSISTFSSALRYLYVY